MYDFVECVYLGNFSGIGKKSGKEFFILYLGVPTKNGDFRSATLFVPKKAFDDIGKFSPLDKFEAVIVNANGSDLLVDYR